MIAHNPLHGFGQGALPHLILPWVATPARAAPHVSAPM